MLRRLEKTLYLGIDPGRHGWFVVYDGCKIVAALPIPYTERGPDVRRIVAVLRVLSKRGVRWAVLEKQQTFGKEGVVSAFSTGRGFGVLEAALEAAEIEYGDPVPSSAWKNEMGIAVSREKLPQLPKRPEKGAGSCANVVWRSETKRIKALRKKLSAEHKKATKDEAVILAQRLAPGYDFRATERSKESSDGKAEAFLLSVLCYRRRST